MSVSIYQAQLVHVRTSRDSGIIPVLDNVFVFSSSSSIIIISRCVPSFVCLMLMYITTINRDTYLSIFLK